VFTRYRLAYFAGAVVLMGGAVIATAVSQTQTTPAADTSQLPDTSVSTSTPEGYEKGNLSEAGARELMTVSDYERAVAISKAKPVLVFKHSTECEISGAAYRRVAAWVKQKETGAPALFLVKVIERRPISQEIAARSEVKHESPQAILFVDAKPVWNASHEAITGEAIDAALKDIEAQPDAKD